MALALGLDYSAGVISGATIKKSGYSFVIRYVGTPGRTKNITRREYQDLTGNGVTVYLVYENSTQDILGGYNGGVTAARLARADATGVGYPTNGVIFFCADRHLTSGEVPIGVQYVKGAASQLGAGSTGAYGFSEFMDGVQGANACTYFWQCGSRSAVRRGVHFYQRNMPPSVTVGGIACDVNEQLLPVSGSPIKPPPIQYPEEDFMYIKCGAAPHTKVAILSGPIFVSMTSPGEIQSAEDAIVRQKAVVQWVEQYTWNQLAAASAVLCANPRIVQTAPPSAPAPTTPPSP